jgi:hypothetical protein
LMSGHGVGEIWERLLLFFVVCTRTIWSQEEDTTHWFAMFFFLRGTKTSYEYIYLYLHQDTMSEDDFYGMEMGREVLE